MNRSTLLSTIATDICTGCGITAATMDSVLDDIANNCLMPEDLAGTGALSPITICTIGDMLGLSPSQSYILAAAGAGNTVCSFLAVDPSGPGAAQAQVVYLNQAPSSSPTAFWLTGVDVAVSGANNFFWFDNLNGQIGFMVDGDNHEAVYIGAEADDGTSAQLQVNGNISTQGSAGVSGSFTSADGHTITVTNGLITGIA